MREKLNDYHRLLFAGLSLILLMTFPAAAQDHGPWTKITTNNFTIFSQVDDDIGRQVAGDLERLHHTLAVLTGGSGPQSPHPTSFYIFANEDALSPYRQAASRSRQNSSVTLGPGHRMEVIGGTPTPGYLVPHEHGNYAVVAGGAGFVPTRYIFKQYIHQRLHEEGLELPYWFSQGLAEYYSSFKSEGELALIGLPSEEHLHWIRYRREPLIPGDTLLRMEAANLTTASPMLQRTFYRQSWLLFHYLLNRENASREQATLFVRKLAAGTSPVEAFEQAYALDADNIKAELEAYLAVGSLKYLKIPVKRLDLLILKFVALKEHEAEYHLGDLLARAVEGGTLRAADRFQRALSLDPDYGPAWAGLGYLAQAAGDLTTAQDHFSKALSVDPENYLTAYLLGKTQLQSLAGNRPANEAQEEVLAQAIKSLTQSVELKDHFAEAWAELGYAHGLQTEASDAGIRAQQRALEFFPARTDLALNLLLAHARRGERSEADAIFRRLEAASKTSGSASIASSLDRAREILLQMDYRDAAQKVRSGQSDEAIALFTRIHVETKNAALKETVAQQLTKLEVVGDFHEFFEIYNQAADAINDGDKVKAQELIDRLAAASDQEWQKGEVKKLKRALAQY